MNTRDNRCGPRREASSPQSELVMPSQEDATGVEVGVAELNSVQAFVRPLWKFDGTILDKAGCDTA